MAQTGWTFELNEKPKVCIVEDPMLYVLTFGKYKGDSLGHIMRTSDGRRYLRWLQVQPCSDPEFQVAHEKRSQRIDQCFQVFDAYVAQLQEQQSQGFAPSSFS